VSVSILESLYLKTVSSRAKLAAFSVPHGSDQVMVRFHCSEVLLL
jgi:hypothetical protein